MKLSKGTKLLTLVVSDFSRYFSCLHHLQGNAHASNIPRITWYSKQKDLRRLIIPQAAQTHVTREGCNVIYIP